MRSLTGCEQEFLIAFSWERVKRRDGSYLRRNYNDAVKVPKADFEIFLDGLTQSRKSLKGTCPF